jgi:hypothetical protein
VPSRMPKPDPTRTKPANVVNTPKSNKNTGITPVPRSGQTPAATLNYFGPPPAMAQELKWPRRAAITPKRLRAQVF